MRSGDLDQSCVWLDARSSADAKHLRAERRVAVLRFARNRGWGTRSLLEFFHESVGTESQHIDVGSNRNKCVSPLDVTARFFRI